MFSNFFSSLFFIFLCVYISPTYANYFRSDYHLDTLAPKVYQKYAKKVEKAIQSFDINPKEVYNPEFKDWTLSAGVDNYIIRIGYGYVDMNKTFPTLVIYGKLVELPDDEETVQEMYTESLTFNYNSDYNKIALDQTNLIYIRVVSLKNLSVLDIKNILLIYTNEFAEKADYYRQKYPNVRTRRT